MRRGLTLGALALALASPLAEAKPKAKKPVDPCAPVEGAPGPGSLDPFRPPVAKAAELNAAGKGPYRQGKWDEARTLYRAAEAADPEFLAPKLNVACSFVRQERFAEATAEVLALLDRAYVPWSREILEAADLGALKVRPEMKHIGDAMAAAAARWGEGLDESVIFVARTRPPLRIPDGAGVFLLNPQQEVWAFTPRTQRYRQLTNEDGHVLASAVSNDRRRIFYVTASKLVRGPKDDDLALRGVTLHALVLASMAEEHSLRLADDLTRLELFQLTPFRFHVGVTPDTRSQLLEYSPEKGFIPTFRQLHHSSPPVAVLTGRGLSAPKAARSPCPFGPPGVIGRAQGAAMGGFPIP